MYNNGKLRKCKHGFNTRKKRIPEYDCWANMIRRCENEFHPCYKYYGGRGIKVCKRWRQNFLNFIEDMGFRPSPKAELDRIDNDGNYTPSNCRWTDRKTQILNSRNKKFGGLLC